MLNINATKTVNAKKANKTDVLNRLVDIVKQFSGKTKKPLVIKNTFFQRLCPACAEYYKDSDEYTLQMENKFILIPEPCQMCSTNFAFYYKVCKR